MTKKEAFDVFSKQQSPCSEEVDVYGLECESGRIFLSEPGPHPHINTGAHLHNKLF